MLQSLHFHFNFNDHDAFLLLLLIQIKWQLNSLTIFSCVYARDIKIKISIAVHEYSRMHLSQ